MGLNDLYSRAKRAWNVFQNPRDPTYYNRDHGYSSYYRPDRPRFSGNNKKSIVTPIFNKIALDVASIEIVHCRVDENGNFLDIMPKSSLNNCLTIEANLDQTGRAFIQDAVISMFDEGVVALTPIDTDRNPDDGTFEVLTMRTAKITQWYSKDVKINVYNEEKCRKEDVIVSKRFVGIVENPFFAVINEPNSTLQRLVRKLNLLDVVDEQSSSGKLDLIIQLPYQIKTPARRQQADERRKSIEEQLTGSKYGIAYADATERITQLNRPIENNLLKQVEYLTSMLYSQLGMTQSILDGTADEKTMNNYYSRTVKPVVTALVDEMKRKFLSKTARSQGQDIMFFRDLFELVTITELTNAADALCRNEITTSNEIRQKMGFKPSKDPKADELINSNMPQSASEEVPYEEEPVYEDESAYVVEEN